MKNNIIFKFIAILLCAASLLGAVGSALGILVLTENDLYNKDVEQVRQERLERHVLYVADSLARMYASSELGGCPEDLTVDMFGYTSHYNNYGYRIVDAEGNVLSTFRETLADSATPFAIPVSGQYMHLVDLESETERLEREAQENEADAVPPLLTSNEIPAEGIAVNRVAFHDRDGRMIYDAQCYDGEYHVIFDYGDGSTGFGTEEMSNRTGYLFVNRHGQVVYTSHQAENFDELPRRDIYSAFFINDELGFSYTLSETAPIGQLTRNAMGQTVFQSFPVAVTVEESIPEQEAYSETVEMVPETSAPALAETTPAVTVPDSFVPLEETEAVEFSVPAEEPVPMETVVGVTVPQETIPSSASAIPEAFGVTTPPTETIEIIQLPPVTVAAEEETLPLIINGKLLEEYQVNSYEYWDNNAQEWMYARYVYLPMPELTVELYVDESSMQDAVMYEVLALLRQVRNYLLPVLGGCLLVFAVFVVYLCTAAGRKPKTDEVRAGGLNRIPLDLYFCGGIFAIACIGALWAEGTEALLHQDFLVGAGYAVGMAFLASLIFVGFCFAFVAQIKTPDGFWYRNTLLGHILRLTARFAVWLEVFLSQKGLPFLGRLIRGTWHLTCRICVWTYRTAEKCLGWIFAKVGRILRWCGHRLNRFLSLLPMTWQWLLMGFLGVSILIIGIDAFKDGHNDMAFPIALLITFGGIFYASHCFGLLSESTKRMSKGDLDTKVEDKLMVGCFKDFAGDLNDLADVAVVAAQKQLKSERMKTELITNVSHDIKTPLTSIINYVDLLQKPHNEEEEQQYLEVLERQSQRLKKLIDDLMDMSKANTGNMQVDITRVDAVESVNQALGEFADKLDRARLIPVFRHDDAQVPMMADGKLVWRVLSNLLGNAVKYAMPGTRLYIDLMTLEGKVVVSLKNISREELNIDADELMERFVRGDDSRNTEGSGLGLNIAKSLMELQKGQLQLLVDGDLFKVTLIFPGV